MKHSICVFIVGSVLASLAQSAYGQCAGPTSVSVGDPTGSCNLGNLETAVGYSVLYNNIANVGGGGFDTAIGAFALSSNTTGTYNTASGAYVLYGNTAGTYNTASGVYALYSNTTGVDNTASGAFALY